MKHNKTCRLRDLMLSKEIYDELNELSITLGLRNSDLCRIVLSDWIRNVKGMGVENVRISIIGERTDKREK